MSDIISRVQDSANHADTDHTQIIYVRLSKLNEEMRQSLDALNQLPGVDLTREQQVRQLEQLRRAYEEKCRLTESFQQLPVFRALEQEQEQQRQQQQQQQQEQQQQEENDATMNDE